MKKILVATDFSERSDRALRRATLLARQHGAKMHLLHVVDDDHPRRIVEANRDQAESLMRALSATIRSEDGLQCDWSVRLGAPHLGIEQGVEAERPDLLVLGPYRRKLLKDVFVGTTAERSIKSAGCPVLVVNAVPVDNYTHIMQTTDLSDASAIALSHFGALRVGRSGRSSVLHVFEAPALRLVMSDTLHPEDRAHYLDDEKKSAATALSTFLSKIKVPRVATLLRHEATSAAHEILKAAQSEQADLIVISTRGRSGMQKFILGSVAEQVLRSASVDVLAIPPSVSEASPEP
ncbi:MAG: universal stress protein [Hyphomonas sp.]|nr:universal stress protein [Hyphomonas sp.]